MCHDVRLASQQQLHNFGIERSFLAMKGVGETQVMLNGVSHLGNFDKTLLPGGSRSHTARLIRDLHGS